jgi:hypothetical protein
LSALTVFCVCVGTKYPLGYVYALQEAVGRHLSVPHVFRCISEHEMPDIWTTPPPAPFWGWWSKANLWAPGVARGPSLYFDLDVVITGSLDYLAEYTQHEFAAPANWAQSGYGGIQSSVMAWRGNWSEPFDYIRRQWPEIMQRLWGDQEAIWEMLGDRWVRIPQVYSYKYHCREGKHPKDMAVCVFHGEPKPHEVHDEWLLPFTSILRERIKSSTGTGLRKASSATA